MEKEIYFHVGTGKTGTTFLQYRVFQNLKAYIIFSGQNIKSRKALLIKRIMTDTFYPGSLINNWKMK